MLSDGISIVSGSGDQTIRIWNSCSGECVKVLEEGSEEYSKYEYYLMLGYDWNFFPPFVDSNVCNFADSPYCSAFVVANRVFLMLKIGNGIVIPAPDLISPWFFSCDP